MINILAPNLLKLTSTKRDIHERKYVKWGMMTLTQYYTVQYNDFNTANPNILLIKVIEVTCNHRLQNPNIYRNELVQIERVT